MSSAERRALLLVRLYPREWRERYGEEFVAMLRDEFEERPRGLLRTLDIVRGASLARMRWAGVTGDALEGEQQLRAGLVTVFVTLGVFLAAGLAVWAQLTIGWRWAAPAAGATRSGMVLLSVAMAVFGALAVAALLPLACSAFRSVCQGQVAGSRAPLALTVCGVLVLTAGSIYFDHGWPGYGGHAWAGRDAVPAIPIAIARVCWSSTFWISTYWAHPGALMRFPLIELAWMMVSPLALVATLAGGARTLRRIPLSAGLLRYESWLGVVAGVVMACALAGAASWVVSAGGPSSGLYRVGVIDLLATVVMGAMLIVAFAAARRSVGVHYATG